MKQNIKRMLKRVIKEEVRKVKRLNEKEDGYSFKEVGDWIRTNIEDAENFSDDQIGVIVFEARYGDNAVDFQPLANYLKGKINEDKAYEEFEAAYPAWSTSMDISDDIERLADRVSEGLFG